MHFTGGVGACSVRNSGSESAYNEGVRKDPLIYRIECLIMLVKGVEGTSLWG
jgi:hypothetical protein